MDTLIMYNMTVIGISTTPTFTHPHPSVAIGFPAQEGIAQRGGEHNHPTSARASRCAASSPSFTDSAGAGRTGGQARTTTGHGSTTTRTARECPHAKEITQCWTLESSSHSRHLDIHRADADQICSIDPDTSATASCASAS
eukprot:4400629-Pyramimonas_sp.AAC.1